MRPQRGGADLNVTAGNGHDNAAHRSPHHHPRTRPHRICYVCSCQRCAGTNIRNCLWLFSPNRQLCDSTTAHLSRAKLDDALSQRMAMKGSDQGSETFVASPVAFSAPDLPTDRPMLDRISHLSIVLDLSPTQWHLSGEQHQQHPLSLQAFLSQLLAFINSHAACKHENTLAVFGAFPGKSVMLYSSTDAPSSFQAPAPDANMYQPFRVINSVLVDKITEELESLKDVEQEEPIALVGALTKALCYINRISSSDTSDDPAAVPDPRVLVLSVSPDQSNSYIPVMNSIFSAQKLKVAIDVCQIFGSETVFLQQAAYLTGGSYVHLTQRDALLQYLIMSFLPSSAVRDVLAVPKQDQVDLRASCFCHKDIVDVGFVCSVCLSIFCAPVPVCSTCRTKFPMKTLQRLNAARAAGGATPARASTPAGTPTATPRATPRPTPAPGTLPSSNSINVGGPGR